MSKDPVWGHDVEFIVEMTRQVRQTQPPVDTVYWKDQLGTAFQEVASKHVAAIGILPKRSSEADIDPEVKTYLANFARSQPRETHYTDSDDEENDDEAAGADPNEAPRSPNFATRDPLINDGRLSNPLLADDLHGII